MIQGVKGARGKASGLLAMCTGRCKDFAMQLPRQVDACADAVPRQDSWKPSFGSACGEPFTLTDASLAAGVGVVRIASLYPPWQARVAWPLLLLSPLEEAEDLTATPSPSGDHRPSRPCRVSLPPDFVTNYLSYASQVSSAS